ncbi:MAG TPA: Cof-type HAD-IIB family hydrolase [Solirubrobacteraceae bacterium]|jgi:Cof subfamily protein (haloacid dehalogenase superfamily)|nr:Cof-type HAD-IIB family hydrolase [Solirubrobacteraceae bacterium]
MAGTPSTAAASIGLLLADVDGTLVTQEKLLTERAIAAVHALGEAGILFAVTSGRPPRGMAMLVEPLALRTPISAFNGGLIVESDAALTSIERRALPGALVGEIVELLRACALEVWMYRGADWYVLDPRGAHVEHESRTVAFAPTVVESFDGIDDGVVKVVGVSDDFPAVQRAAQDAQERFGGDVSASRSQPYYIDVTHPDANKGAVVKWLAARYELPLERIATIGDMPNDVLMFAHSGLSIAMGNADREVQRAARHVTTTNEQEGFAHGVERWILGER